MSEILGSPIRDGLNAIPSYENWVSSVNELEDQIKAHPTKGSADSFDMYDDEHLQAQLRLNPLIFAQFNRRGELRRAIIDPAQESLDVIAKLAVLHAIDQFSPDRFFKQERTKYFDTATGSRILRAPKSRKPRLETVDQVEARAERIDQALRDIDEALEDTDNEIGFAERFTWHELKWPTGKQLTVEGETVTTGIAREKSKSYAISHPTSTNYSLPHFLRNVIVLDQVGSDTGRKKRKEPWTDLFVEEAEGVRKVTIPLTNVETALGYIAGVTGPSRRSPGVCVTTELIINGIAIPS